MIPLRRLRFLIRRIAEPQSISASNVPRLEPTLFARRPLWFTSQPWTVDVSFVPFLVKKNAFFLNKINQGVSLGVLSISSSRRVLPRSSFSRTTCDAHSGSGYCHQTIARHLPQKGTPLAISPVGWGVLARDKGSTDEESLCPRCTTLAS